MALGVFGKTKLTDLVLQQPSNLDDQMQAIVQKIEQGKASPKDLFKAIDNEVNNLEGENKKNILYGI